MTAVSLAVIRVIALGNGAAGAEKQALALGTRVLAHLSRADAAKQSTLQLLSVPLSDRVFFQRLPPVLQVAAALVTRDPFFGYALSDTTKRALLGRDDTGDKPRRRVKLVIGCGRSTVSICAALKRLGQRSNEQVINVQIQHPRVPLGLFDAVITPRHDFEKQANLPSNVYHTHGTMCALDHETLQHQGDAWREALTPYLDKHTRLTWLVGGSCRGFAFNEREAHDMADQVLAAMASFRPNASLMVTFSRRTPPQAQVAIETRLRASLCPDSELFVWNGQGANPFNAFLHHATAIVTTPDSVSMTTEAILTGKPVLTLATDRTSGKFQRFHQSLLTNAYTAPVSASSLATTAAASHGSTAIEAELDAIAAKIAHQVLSVAQ
ncbi:hypothetical protein Poli38472_005452 [Pythium oligandrum]|uniref:Mitochondrial fission protein ELM1 n=1 Tax=Pythium oligandrum TaxID=41045 RepID=A0A8K1FJ76_PYTOL|nr:hypothetical protein Poli38472_005452 [Pythium oligandrum]|eukprot:TMW62834.1 hypothetical protein Poli38472_005452 [Pythium oligandrum]